MLRITMLIKIGYDIELAIEASITPSALVFLLQVHPSRSHDLVNGERLRVTPGLTVDHYRDAFNNRCARVQVPPGIARIRLTSEAVIRDSGQHDPVFADAYQSSLDRLPTETLQYLLPSRYCEVDSELLAFAWQRFGNVPPGWARVQAICDFVHNHINFSYQNARSTRTALEGFRERTGVCRDFTHLAVALCRCMNIPARYVTGYLGDIGVPVAPYPMDYSAWFEAYVGDRWYSFDARHNVPRIGRIPVAHGRDAADVPITMFFGTSKLERFDVVTEEVTEQPAAPVFI
jgi:transglutaminase-like putative cysteine protease